MGDAFDLVVDLRESGGRHDEPPALDIAGFEAPLLECHTGAQVVVDRCRVDDRHDRSGVDQPAGLLPARGTAADHQDRTPADLDVHMEPHQPRVVAVRQVRTKWATDDGSPPP